MKTDTHPKFNISATATCASCEEKYAVGSTKESIEVEICANCHPFYTGQEKMTDIAGRVERFRIRASQAKSPKKAK
jgi:large subunit ribosomal protein L31